MQSRIICALGLPKHAGARRWLYSVLLIVSVLLGEIRWSVPVQADAQPEEVADTDQGENEQLWEGKDPSDVAILLREIEKQRAMGATVSEDLNSGEYSWNTEGRLTAIYWESGENHDFGLQGTLSLDGLTELKSVHCYGNRLESLSLVQNDSLQILNCRDNELTTLDLSGCRALKDLDCSDNRLQTLDISDSGMLVQLRCNNNFLHRLDLSYNNALNSLQCGDNLLTSIELADCTELVWLTCGNNHLSKLDLTGNTKLEHITCSNNYLTDLLVSNNEKLTDLDCANNRLKSLDLHHNRELQSLNCSGNYLSELDVSDLTSLTSVSKDNVASYDEVTQETKEAIVVYENDVQIGSYVRVTDALAAMTQAESDYRMEFTNAGSNYILDEDITLPQVKSLAFVGKAEEDTATDTTKWITIYASQNIYVQSDIRIEGIKLKVLPYYLCRPTIVLGTHTMQLIGDKRYAYSCDLEVVGAAGSELNVAGGEWYMGGALFVDTLTVPQDVYFHLSSNRAASQIKVLQGETGGYFGLSPYYGPDDSCCQIGTIKIQKGAATVRDGFRFDVAESHGKVQIGNIENESAQVLPIIFWCKSSPADYPRLEKAEWTVDVKGYLGDTVDCRVQIVRYDKTQMNYAIEHFRWISPHIAVEQINFSVYYNADGKTQAIQPYRQNDKGEIFLIKSNETASSLQYKATDTIALDGTNCDETYGVYYELDEKEQTASVCKNPNIENQTGEWLEDIIIPSHVVKNDITYTVTAIKEHAFDGWWSRMGGCLWVSDTVTTIEDDAFSGTQLWALWLGKGVKNISASGLANQALRQIAVDEDNPYYSSYHDVLYNKQRTKIVRVAPNIDGSYYNAIDSYVIPDEVTEIAPYAFYSDWNFWSIQLSAGVTIGKRAFDQAYVHSVDVDHDVEEWQENKVQVGTLDQIDPPKEHEPTATPVPTATPTPEPTATPTETPTAVVTASPTVSSEPTVSPTVTSRPVVTPKPTAVPLIRHTNRIRSVKLDRQNHPKLQWQRCTQVTGYEIWRTEGGKKTYRRIAKTTGTGTVYVDTKTKAGTRYRYKIRCYRENGKTVEYGKMSAGKQIRTENLIKPKIKASTGMTDDGIRFLSIKLLRYGGTKAALYYRTKKSAWKRLKITESSIAKNHKRFLIRCSDRRQTYYLRVRTFCKKNGMTIYSPYSNTAKVRVSK